ncbi:MAG: transaldolase [Solirubrobacteraceae bacterium]|nr:transaldolase [Solirubrobacteraceae bacterium]
MNPTAALNAAGQSLWLDNITRTMLDDQTLAGYLDELSVTGLTSNPTIFEKAIGAGDAYDDQIAEVGADGSLSDEQVFFALAIDDLRRAADLFAEVHERTAHADGFVSLEVSPELAFDTEATVAQARELYARMERPNVFIKIPGTPEGLPAITRAIHEGIPVNVTLLFDSAHHLAAADAWMAGIERRIADGLPPDVPSVASLFMSRWDVKANPELPAELRNRLGLAIGGRAYVAYGELLASPRMQRLMNAGARPQRLLWASTGTKDPDASATLYIDGLASPYTVNTMPDGTLHAFAGHGAAPPALLPPGGGDAEDVLAAVARAGVDVAAYAADLQRAGAAAFVDSWHALLATIAGKRAAVTAGG